MAILNKAHNLGRVFVLDLEATCWQDPITGSKNPPEGQEKEIIEIGFCLLRAKDKSLTRPQRLLIKPTKTEGSKFCTDLTAIPSTMLKRQGMPFEEACRRLIVKQGSSSRMWASWGDGDLSLLMRQCDQNNVTYPFSATHYNAQTLYALMNGLKDLPSLETALKENNMSFVGLPHNGGDDAFNTGRLLGKMLWGVEPTIREDK